MKLNDQGVFIHRVNYSESSVIATFYTRNHGIQRFLFQGAKKKKVGLFPLNCCELTFYKRPDSELQKLTQMDAISPLTSILSHPFKNIMAFFIADVIRNCLHTDEREEPIFQFLLEQIALLETTVDVGAFPLLFLSEFTNYIGIQPNRSEEEPSYFYLMDGEFHHDYRMGEICEEGEVAQALYHLFFHQHVPVSNRKKLLESILHYYTIHIPNFNVNKSLEVIREVLN